MGSYTQSGSCTSWSRIRQHKVLRKAEVIACWSPDSTAASKAATNLAWPGNVGSGQGEAFMARILRRAQSAVSREGHDSGHAGEKASVRGLQRREEIRDRG